MLQLGLNVRHLLLHKGHGAGHELRGLGEEGFAGGGAVEVEDAVDLVFGVGLVVGLDDDRAKFVHAEGLGDDAGDFGIEVVLNLLLLGGELVPGGLLDGCVLHGGGHLVEHLVHHRFGVGEGDHLLNLGALGGLVGVGQGKGEEEYGGEGEESAEHGFLWVIG